MAEQPEDVGMPSIGSQEAVAMAESRCMHDLGMAKSIGGGRRRCCRLVMGGLASFGGVGKRTGTTCPARRIGQLRQ